MGRTFLEARGVRIWTRDGTSDQFIFREVVRQRCYRKLKIAPSDVVLDAGANIGIFSVVALMAGARVYGFEPEPENCALARENAELSGYSSNFELYERALVGDRSLVRDFSVNLKKNKGAHSLVPKRGRETIRVECENINSALERIRPTVVKMDIEGESTSA